MTRAKYTTPESIEMFRLAVEDVVRAQVWSAAAHVVPTLNIKQEDIDRYNHFIMLWMRDHCRALGNHYNALHSGRPTENAND